MTGHIHISYHWPNTYKNVCINVQPDFIYIYIYIYLNTYVSNDINTYTLILYFKIKRKSYKIHPVTSYNAGTQDQLSHGKKLKCLRELILIINDYSRYSVLTWFPYSLAPDGT